MTEGGAGRRSRPAPRTRVWSRGLLSLSRLVVVLVRLVWALVVRVGIVLLEIPELVELVRGVVLLPGHPVDRQLGRDPVQLSPQLGDLPEGDSLDLHHRVPVPILDRLQRPEGGRYARHGSVHLPQGPGEVRAPGGVALLAEI